MPLTILTIRLHTRAGPVLHLLSGLDHRYPVLGLGRPYVLPCNDLGQLHIGKVVHTKTIKVSRQMQSFT